MGIGTVRKGGNNPRRRPLAAVIVPRPLGTDHPAGLINIFLGRVQLLLNLLGSASLLSGI